MHAWRAYRVRVVHSGENICLYAAWRCAARPSLKKTLDVFLRGVGCTQAVELSGYLVKGLCALIQAAGIKCRSGRLIRILTRARVVAKLYLNGMKCSITGGFPIIIRGAAGNFMRFHEKQNFQELGRKVTIKENANSAPWSVNPRELQTLLRSFTSSPGTLVVAPARSACSGAKILVGSRGDAPSVDRFYIVQGINREVLLGFAPQSVLGFPKYFLGDAGGFLRIHLQITTVLLLLTPLLVDVHRT